MRILDVEALALSAPTPHPVENAVGNLDRRNNIVVQVITDAGTGLGESWINFPGWGIPARRNTILQGLKPLIVGREVDSPQDLWREMEPRLHRLGLQTACIGEMYQAWSAIDIALWDVVAKMNGLPLYAVLRRELAGDAGDAFSSPPAVEAYASGLGPKEPLPLTRAHLEQGVRKFKVKVGLDLERDRRNLAAVRDLIGDENTLMIDANQAWGAETAVAAVQRLEGFHLRWLEEPVYADDRQAWEHVRSRVKIPLAAGENIYGQKDWNEVLESGLLDVVQPDVTKAGGFTPVLDVIRKARQHDVEVVLHFLGSAVGLMATLQLTAAIPDGSMLVEFDANPNPLRTVLTEPAITLRDGKVRLPEAPGLGIRLEKETMEAYHTAGKLSPPSTP